jgi:hypothetical protein
MVTGSYHDFMEHIWTEHGHKEGELAEEATLGAGAVHAKKKEKEYNICPHCNHKFRRIYNLRMHIRYIHEGHTLFCPHCDRKAQWARICLVWNKIR